VALSADVATLDPWNATDLDTLLVTRQIFETLVDFEPGALRIVPKLAESWSSSPDGTTWTFSLRKGVRFHDGTELTAAAVALNFDRARLSGHPGRGTGAFAPYAATFGGFDDASTIVKVGAKDPATVVFTTRSAFAPFLAALAMPSFAIVSPKSIADDPARWAMSASAAAAGTGPFSYGADAWQPGQQLTLERSATYWGRDRDGRSLPYLDRVVVRSIKDESARVSELRSGAIELVRDVSPSVIPQLKADPNLVVAIRSGLNVSFLGISQDVKPFDRLEVRRAVAGAIDRQRIASSVYGPDVHVASQLLPPGIVGYDDSVVEFARYDLAAAKRSLADAGFPNGFATELWYPQAWRASALDPRRVADAIASDLGRVGIFVTVNTKDAATLAADVRAGRVPLWLGEAGADLVDPDAYISDPWKNPVVSELLRRARAELDATKRGELYKQVSKLTQQDVARIPLVLADPHLALSGRVRGLMPHATGGEALTLVWLGR